MDQNSEWLNTNEIEILAYASYPWEIAGIDEASGVQLF